MAIVPFWLSTDDMLHDLPVDNMPNPIEDKKECMKNVMGLGSEIGRKLKSVR